MHEHAYKQLLLLLCLPPPTTLTQFIVYKEDGDKPFLIQIALIEGLRPTTAIPNLHQLGG